MTVKFEEVLELIDRRVVTMCDTKENVGDLFERFDKLGECRISGKKPTSMLIYEGEEESEMVINFDEIKVMLDGEVIVHCNTEEKANNLLKNLDNLGFMWRSGEELINKANYSYYGYDTCYRISNNDNRLQYCSLDFYKKERFNIYEYEMSEKEVGGLKIHELAEGVEYKIKGLTNRFKIVDGVLKMQREPSGDCNSNWINSLDSYNYINSRRFIECEFNPKIDEKYYYPKCEFTHLYDYMLWENDSIDNSIKRNVGVYRTKEQAIEKAKELGWT